MTYFIAFFHLFAGDETRCTRLHTEEKIFTNKSGWCKLMGRTLLPLYYRCEPLFETMMSTSLPTPSALGSSASSSAPSALA